jgi:hypothetical protein
MSIFDRYGNVSVSAVLTKLSATTTASWRQYGRMYPIAHPNSEPGTRNREP